MKGERLQWFFKSREYRKMYLLYVRKNIINWVKKPFIYIKAIYDTIKLNIDYPDRWDRYVKLKEIENNTILEEKFKKKAIAYTKLLGTIYRFDICLLAYCSYSNIDDTTQESYEVLYDDFDQIKKDFQKFVNELEEMAVVIPDELKTMIESTNVDRFMDFDEYKIFSDNLHDISDTIDVTC